MSMKKTMAVMLAVLFGAIGGIAQTEENTPAVTTTADKILVVYFSHGGNTKFAAEQIRKLTGGSIFAIEPVKVYPGDYTKCVNRTRKEIADGVMPELKTKVKDISKYDVIFIGSPNWWSTIAPPVATFLTSYDFSGKTIVPFITHGGSGVSYIRRDIRLHCPKAKVLPIGSFTGIMVKKSEKDIKKFVQESVAVKAK